MKHFLLAAFSLAVCVAQPVINPGTAPVVNAGETFTFTASSSHQVRWSLASGSVGTIDSVTGVYAAPSSIVNRSSRFGCMIVSDNHALHANVAGLPTTPDSIAVMAGMPPGGLLGIPVFPVNIYDSSTPSQDFQFLYTPGNNGSFQYEPNPLRRQQQASALWPPTVFVDRHILSVNKDSCVSSEIYNEYPAGANQRCLTCTAQSGTQWTETASSRLPSGATTAAGVQLLPLILRARDFYSGSLGHAIGFTMTNSYIAAGDVHRWPATAAARPYCTNRCLYYGDRLRLKSNVNTDGLSPLAQVLATGLKTHGMILVDGGLNWDLLIAEDVAADPLLTSAINEVKALMSSPRTQMEIVDQSVLQYQSSDGGIAPSLNAEVTPGYAWTVPNFARVIATDIVTNRTAERSIILRGIQVGMAEYTANIQVGASVPLKAWSSSGDLTWSISPAIPGCSLSESGIFDATGCEVTQPTRTMVTATSTADPNVSDKMAVWVWPAGTIRLEIGGLSGATVGYSKGGSELDGTGYFQDSSGNKWWSDTGRSSVGASRNDQFWNNGWPPNSQLFFTFRSAYNERFGFKFHVPNGKYRVRLYAGRNNGGSGPYASIHTVNDQQVARNYKQTQNWMTEVMEYPANVTDGVLEVWNHPGVLDPTGNSVYPQAAWAAMEIYSTDEAPSIGIDTSAVSSTNVVAGQKLRLHSVGWYMPNSVNWSVSQGPGTIDANGVYTAPLTPPASSEPVVIRATSTTVPTAYAEMALTFVFGNLEVSTPPSMMNRGKAHQFSANLSGTPTTRVVWSASLGEIDSNGLYRAPDRLQDDTPVTVMATSVDDPTATATTTFTARSEFPPIRAYLGGTGPSDKIDSRGQRWVYSVASCEAPQNKTTYAFPSNTIQGVPASDQFLYNGATYLVYSYGHRTMTCSWPVAPGKYVVTLKFANYNDPNQTVPFIGNYSINGKTVLSNFNVVTAAGGVLRPVDRSFLVEVGLERSIDIGVQVPSGAIAVLNAVEIVEASQSSVNISGEASLTGKVTVE